MKWLIHMLMIASTASAQTATTSPTPNPATEPALIVSGLSTEPLTLHPKDLSTWNRISVKAKDRDGKEYVFSGVSLADILLKAGVPLGSQLRGKQMANYLLVQARDGYQVVFALPELDTSFTNRTILLADQVDGKPLPATQGPFRLVVPEEKKHARWVWGVTAVSVETAAQPTVLVAAAADLRYAMDSIIAHFKTDNPGADIQVVYGSSGNFYEQILAGGPFDLFFSADMDYVNQLKAAGKVSGPVIGYGTGHLVLWSLHLDPSRGMALLSDPAVSKIAVANPAHAPYGKKAVESLRYFKCYEQVQAKLVMGENISQAAQYAASESADVGLVALSLALSPPMQQTGGRYWSIPDESHGALAQGFALLNHGANNPIAVAFAAFIQTEAARTLLRKFGL